MSRRFNPGFMAMGAKLLLERTFCEVGLPLWVERVGGLPDFDMAPDFGFARIHEAFPNRLAVRCPLSRFTRKRPRAMAQGGEALLLHPVSRFLGMSAFGPVPESLPYLMVYPDPARGKCSARSFASPSKVMFASVGEMMPPCGVPASVGNRFRFSM